MTIDKKAKPGLGLFLIMLALAFNLLETWYFGWNETAQSVQEMVADNICNVLILVGVFEMFSIHIETGSDAKETEEDED